MIPILQLTDQADRDRIDALLTHLRLDPRDVALNRGDRAKAVATVTAILADVAQRGDAAVVDSSRQFDDPNFSAEQIRVSKPEMEEAVRRTPAEQMAALCRSIAQVKEISGPDSSAAARPGQPRWRRAGAAFYAP